MPVFSLPSPYGIGTMGKHAYEFADYAASCGAKIWQVLPLGPTGYGDSPYQSFSSFAGNPYFIDPDFLVRDGLLKKADLPKKLPEGNKINYGEIYLTRGEMLRRAFAYSWDKVSGDAKRFAGEHPEIMDYALFMTAKTINGGVCWHDFPEELMLHEKNAVKELGEKHADEVNYHIYTQYLFFSQWKALKKYVNSLGMELLGDMPIYVAPDSADAWANPENFQFDQRRNPSLVAGVPPDYFSEDGQKWGNPLYDWDYIKNDGYSFWIRRVKAAAELYDAVRIDHFIGFANYYSVKAECPTAREGFWRDGPGIELFDKIKKEVPRIRLIAEDLGVVSDKVITLLKQTGYPSMRVLQFAFGGEDDNMHLPSNVPQNSVVYTSTHDNVPTCGWWENTSQKEKAEVARRLGKESPKMPDDLIRCALDCRAETVIIPMWDILGLGMEATVNAPGTAEGNWCWRLDKIPQSSIDISRK